MFESVHQPLEGIDDTVLAARKAYHRVEDAVSKNIDTTFLRGGEILDDIKFVDFYRYTDVTLEEMLNYLDMRLPWIRPSDTGRSTNCLINDVGIFVHKKERGYHNYAWPYSWDVRVGHKKRDEALEELDDEIDLDRTTEILNTIGYSIRRAPAKIDKTILHAYYVADAEIDAATLRSSLSQTLPQQAVPSTFTRLDSIPLTPNGKADRRKLSKMRSPAETPENLVVPENEIEKIVHGIWCELLGAQSVSTDAHFHESGGNSILAIQVIARISHAFDIEIPFAAAFTAPTIQDMAAIIEGILLSELDD